MKTSKTKEYITQALFCLLEKKEYADITVQDVVSRAGVCRASFYRNFFTMDEVIERFLEEVFAGAYRLDAMTAETIESCVREFFKKAREHSRELQVLMRRGLLHHINAVMYRQTVAQINELQVFNNRYQPYFFSGASASMLCAWVEGGFAESEEDMARIFMESLRGYLRV